MRRKSVFYKYTIRTLLFFAMGSLSFAVPKTSIIKAPVNDYAGIISNYYQRRITRLIVNHHKKTGVQIAVLTLPSIGNVSIDEFSKRIAEQWAGGSKERDDGLLFVVAVQNRKMRLEVGKGLMGYIPHYKALAILQSIQKDFRKKDYNAGVLTVIDTVIAETAAINADDPIPVTSKMKGILYSFSSVFTLVFLIGMLLGFAVVHWYPKDLFLRIGKILLFMSLWFGVPVLLFFYFPGVWIWNPVVYLTGFIAGQGFGNVKRVYQVVPEDKKKILSHFGYIYAIVPASISFVSILVLLDIMAANPFGTSRNETIALFILIPMNLAQFVFSSVEKMTIAEAKMGVYATKGSGGYRNYQSGQSPVNNSAGNTSSSNSSSDSWKGGGGSFGGGGASSSW